ncbi:hypothetical protein KZJ38_29695 [Paraburkholderia edwinii]|jgi:hypothetical protein|uniref:Uncharacterized protein n=1 Tax=Paraburkholderia edwinii TaxID=2861782 RepID=A0ABX8UQE9_9BURK|nr:hypothetical protein [Paraburkholderia edwinii]QYD71222.1 hypothetical protein KZJ38_29695 [Paraburkholderia edwinii]
MSAKRYPGYDTASGFPLKQQNALNFEQQIESRGREKKGDDAFTSSPMGTPFKAIAERRSAAL